MANGVTVEPFGSLSDGREARLYTLEASGISAAVSDYGATLVSLRRATTGGGRRELILGFDDASGYELQDAYLGATVGRYANRIAGARFTLGGKEHGLSANDGPNCLHGGMDGFSRRSWKVEPGLEGGCPALFLTLESPAGDQGFPGAVSVVVSYVLAGDALRIAYSAETDEPTPFGMTNHAYWNLYGCGDILSHELTVNASRYLPVDERLIPLPGEPAPVAGTPFDFREPKPIGRDLAAAGGYDHCYALDGAYPGSGEGGRVGLAATLREPRTGQGVEVWTDLPGLQCYSGNFLDIERGRAGARYGRHGGLCLEPEAFPDAPNRPDYPDSILYPGRPYRASIEYRLLG